MAHACHGSHVLSETHGPTARIPPALGCTSAAVAPIKHCGRFKRRPACFGGRLRRISIGSAGAAGAHRQPRLGAKEAPHRPTPHRKTPPPAQQPREESRIRCNAAGACGSPRRSPSITEMPLPAAAASAPTSCRGISVPCVALRASHCFDSRLKRGAQDRPSSIRGYLRRHRPS